MDDDFNTPLAIAAIFDMVRAINTYADKNTSIKSAIKNEIYETVIALLNVLGIKIEIEKEKSVRDQMALVNNLADLILELRQEMRKRKEWKIADEIRDKLQKLGFVIEDTPIGTKWRLKKTKASAR